LLIERGSRLKVKIGIGKRAYVDLIWWEFYWMVGDPEINAGTALSE